MSAPISDDDTCLGRGCSGQSLCFTESVTGKDLPPVCRPEAPVCIYVCMYV